MKKALLFTLAALCVSAVQAVAFSWTKFGTGLAAGSYELDATKTANGVSVALIVDIATPPTGNVLNGVMGLISDTYSGFMSAGVSYSHVYMWRSYTTNGSTPEGYGAKQDNTSFKTGENVFGMSIYQGTNNGTPCVKIDYYFNGLLVASDSTGIRWSNQPITNLDELLIGDVAAGADVYIAYGVGATEEQFDSIPEPTALALLALGVAGFALKRKVA